MSNLIQIKMLSPETEAKIRKSFENTKKFPVNTFVYRNDPENYYHGYHGTVQAISVHNPKNRLVRWMDGTSSWIHIKYLTKTSPK